MSSLQRSAPSALPAPVWAAIYVGVAAATLPAILPVMVGVFAEQLAFGLDGAGYAASLNLGGVALGSVLGALLARRWQWRQVIILGIATMIVANLLTMAGTTFAYVSTMRFAAGLGEGLVAGICYAAMGRSGQATRALAFYVAGQGLVGAVGMGLMPTLIGLVGWQVLFVATSLVALPAFWLAGSIGSLQELPARAAVAIRIDAMTGLAWGAVAALLAQFVGMSSIWAFLERLGHAKGIDPTHLSLALSASAIANMLGSLAVGIFTRRLGGLPGLAAAFVLFVASLSATLLWNEWQAYCIATVLFMLAWAVYFPFQFGLLARFDRGGALAAITPAVTGVGFTIGPALGGYFMSTGGTIAILGLGFGCVLASTLGCVLLQRMGRQSS